LQKLNTTLSNIKVPAIKVPEPNFGNFFSAIDKIEAKTLKIKSVIEPPNTVSGGFSSFLNSEKGKFANVGKEMGQTLTMGMTQQFGVMGGMATSVATALGPIGIAAGAAAVGVGVLAAASVNAAMAWEDMKTSIGRTTGLKGDNLEDLMNQLQDLRQEFGVTAQAASSMVEQAGSIGVGQSKLTAGDVSGYKQEILDFTKATAILQGAWGMSAESTAQGIGKMGSVTLGAWNVQRKARGEEEMSWADYAYRVGGQVDNLANAMGSSEEEIVTAMRNSSGAIAKYAPSEETYGKWQAMASFLIDTGSSAGEAGTQIERVAQKMDQNGAGVAAILGIDQASLSSSLKTDFMGTVQGLGEAIAALPESERPDTAKMFGLEGKVLIDKVVADIEAGTGKLQGAIDLAMKPGNVAQGYEDVADNASKAFDRIGQAAQVSLEKIGGLLLPIVADIANTIADAWVKGNQLGSEAFVAAQKLATGAGSAMTSATNSYLSFMGYNNADYMPGGKYYTEPQVDTDAANAAAAYKASAMYKVGEQATSGASFSDASFKDLGSKTGIGYVDALNQELNTALPKTFSDNYLKLYDVAGQAGKQMGSLFGQAYLDKVNELLKENSPEVAALIASGMTTNAALAAAESQSGGQGKMKRADNTMSILGSQYTLRQTESNNTKLNWWKGPDDTEWKEIESSGKDTSEAIADAYYNDLRGSIKNSAKFMETQYTGMSSDLGEVVSDGIFGDMERKQLEVYKELLETYKQNIPLDFSADDQALLTNIDDILSGKTFEVNLKASGDFEADFALWLQQKADLYVAIADVTGQIPKYEQQRSRHDWEADKTTPEQTKTWINAMEQAVTSKDVGLLSTFPSLKKDIEELSPEITKETWYRQLLSTGMVEYNSQVKQVGNSLVVLDAGGKQLGTTFLITDNHIAMTNGSLLQFNTAILGAAAAAISAASSFSSAHASSYGSAGTTWQGTSLTSSKWSGQAISAAFANPYAASNLESQFKAAGAWYDEGIKTGVVAQSGPAWVQKGERVIKESDIKGLYPDFAKAAKGSMQYLTGEKFFEDYQYQITPPSGYQYSKWPNAPQVNVSGNVPSAWLSEGQTTGMEMISSEIRAMQLDAIKTGAGSVVPYWLKGEVAQPDWWTEAATALSPKYAENWAANKGGAVPSIDTGDIKVNDNVTLLRDPRSDACIPLLSAPYLKTTDEFYLNSGSMKINEDVTLLKDPRSDSCIPLLKAPYLKTTDPFYLASGSMPLSARQTVASSSDRAESILADIEDNTAASEKFLSEQIDILSTGIFETSGSLSNFPGGAFSVGGSGALVTGLSKEGYIATYDPRTDTCEGLSFVAPDASLKTTDPFYLGLSTNSPYRSEDKEPGYGWSNVATAANSDLKNQMKVAEESYKEQQKTEENTSNIYDQLGKQYALQQQALSLSGLTLDATGMLVSSVGGGGGSSGLYGSTSGSFWGGLSVSGGGGWVGTGASSSGWGAQASANAGSSGSYGGVSWGWAEGGITDHPVYGVFGEAGREAFVPISDRAAGRRILPQVMKELGIRTFASGGFAGHGSASALGGFGDINITVINNSKTAVNEKKLAKEIESRLTKKMYEAAK
jgi:hypothetical protein